MTYQETLDWLFGRLPMYQEKGKDAFKAKLDNIRDFCKFLGDPHFKFKSIHVGGTNGKGSCSHLLASVMQEAGYKVGLYTSPHLKDFRERIRINGQPVSEEYVVRFVDTHREFLEAKQLSFFEMSVGMAFDSFANEEVDIAIVEVGLGGRLDSTNIIRPEACLITNIGWDHMDLLGNSLSAITLEKAGIIKKDIPVVISEYDPETAPIFEEVAREKEAPIVFASHEIEHDYPTSLLGHYQARNVKGVVAILGVLKGFEIEETHIRQGLLNVVSNTGILGRWQVIGHEPLIICDTAHNREGITLVIEQLQTEEYKNLHMVLGFVQDKDLEVILPLFPKDATYYFSRPNIRRGLDAANLKEAAINHGMKGKLYSGISEALAAAKENASNEDLIYVGGSTFTVAEVL